MRDRRVESARLSLVLALVAGAVYAWPWYVLAAAGALSLTVVVACCAALAVLARSREVE